jgi:hypothetical protein
MPPLGGIRGVVIFELLLGIRWAPSNNYKNHGKESIGVKGEREKNQFL